MWYTPFLHWRPQVDGKIREACFTVGLHICIMLKFAACISRNLLTPIISPKRTPKIGIAKPTTMDPILPRRMYGHSGMFFFRIVNIEMGGGSSSSSSSITGVLSSSWVWMADLVEEDLLTVLISLPNAMSSWSAQIYVTYHRHSTDIYLALQPLPQH